MSRRRSSALISRVRISEARPAVRAAADCRSSAFASASRARDLLLRPPCACARPRRRRAPRALRPRALAVPDALSGGSRRSRARAATFRSSISLARRSTSARRCSASPARAFRPRAVGRGRPPTWLGDEIDRGPRETGRDSRAARRRAESPGTSPGRVPLFLEKKQDADRDPERGSRRERPSENLLGELPGEADGALRQRPHEPRPPVLRSHGFRCRSRRVASVRASAEPLLQAASPCARSSSRVLNASRRADESLSSPSATARSRRLTLSAYASSAERSSFSRASRIAESGRKRYRFRIQ